MPGQRRLVLAAGLLVLAALLLGPLAGAPQASERVIPMPNVRGKQLKEARRILNYEGFDSINLFTVETDKRGLAGVVQSQYPPAGAEVPVSVTVKLSVYEYNP